MANQYLVDSPYSPFTIKNQFKAISNGKVYIGEVDKDPLNPSQQIQVYVVDETGSNVPISQPIQLNAGGYLVYNGQVSKFITLKPYSMVVLNNVNAEMWRVGDISKVDPESFTHNQLKEINAVGGHDAIYSRVFNSQAEMVAYTGHSLNNTYLVMNSGIKTSYSVVATVSDVNLGGGLWAEISTLNAASVLHSVVRQTNDKAIPAANLLASLRASGTRVNLVPIGDSFGDGVGASMYENRYVNVLDRMLNNSMPKGYGLGTNTRLTDVVGYAGSGFTSTGTITTNGALESQLRLLPGEVLEITGYELDFADVWHYGGTTTGDLKVYLNNVQINTLVTYKVGAVATTFPNSTMPRRIEKTDVIKFEATGGLVDITGFNPVRSSVGGAYQLSVSHGGWSYKTYDNQAIVDEINAYGSFEGGVPVYMLELGTNSIYNASEAQTPSEMIASMVSFITKLAAANPAAGFMVCVPPKAIETTWPVIKAGYSYEDYQTALIDYGDLNGVQLIRLDKINLAKFGMYSDGLHPIDAGHILLAQIMAKSFGMSQTAFDGDQTRQTVLRSGVTYNDLWGDFGNGLKYYEEGGRASLSGFAAKNGSASSTVGFIPASGFPQGRDPQFFCVTDTGTTTIAIDKNTGAIVITGTAVTTWVAIEITWVISPS